MPLTKPDSRLNVGLPAAVTSRLIQLGETLLPIPIRGCQIIPPIITVSGPTILQGTPLIQMKRQLPQVPFPQRPRTLPLQSRPLRRSGSTGKTTPLTRRGIRLNGGLTAAATIRKNRLGETLLPIPIQGYQRLPLTITGSGLTIPWAIHLIPTRLLSPGAPFPPPRG